MMDERYELIVIGAGTAGFAAAETARADGRSVLVVSGPGDLGGTCILRGCMPAKTLLSSTERLRTVERATELAIDEPAPAHVDVPKLISRKRELVEYFATDRVHELETYPLVRGCARFVAPDAIAVGERVIHAERFIIATGSHIVAPEIPGLASAGFLTSDDVLEQTTVPRAIAIVGGGPVGCEFAQYFARVGAQVTLLQDGPALLRKEDDDIAAAVRSALERDGIDVVCDATIAHVARSGDQRVVTYTTGDATASVHVDAVMLASGRVPKLDGLDVAAAGIIGDAAHLAVDPYLRTTNHNVSVAGDALGRRCLVHVAEYAGKLAARNAFSASPIAADFDRFEAHAVYTQPQVAVAGLTERTLRERGIPYSVRRHPFRDIGKALVSDEAEGFIAMMADRDGRIRGVKIFADDAIDLIGEAIALIDRGATVREIAEMPHLHPTMGEIYARVADDLLEAVPAP